MSPEQQARVDQLTPEEIQAIDEALLSNTSHKSRKVARVVGTTMMNAPSRRQGIPDLFYAQRIQHLVATANSNPKATSTPCSSPRSALRL